MSEETRAARWRDSALQKPMEGYKGIQNFRILKLKFYHEMTMAVQRQAYFISNNAQPLAYLVTPPGL